jgi:hypothetical protein
MKPNRVNRATLAFMVSRGEPLRGVLNRAVGKTTSAILRALAESYDTPARWITIEDPDVQTRMGADELMLSARRMCSSLNLTCIEVTVLRDAACGRYSVRVCNTFAEVIS